MDAKADPSRVRARINGDPEARYDPLKPRPDHVVPRLHDAARDDHTAFSVRRDARVREPRQLRGRARALQGPRSSRAYSARGR